ncbi:MAG: Fic family protein [Bacteroidota bacterium]|nr:Fic family protein [Bacteroidota bacterium]
MKYVYQYKDWPLFHWDNEVILPLLGEVRHLQGKLVGKMETLGFTLRSEAILDTLTQDVLKSTEIEGEFLKQDQVRSSIARKLGLEVAGLVRSDRHVDGVVTMMLNATQQFKKPLTKERLFDWHTALFPGGKSDAYTILVGKWRDDSTGPMQVVSGAMGKEKVHYQAPVAKVVNKEMAAFIKWFNATNVADPVLKASLAHFWFVTVHPFDDGNGRVARAITDMQLARADGHNQRFYSMSAQIRLERNNYYSILEKTQKGDLDITEWHLWFLNCLYGALKASNKLLESVLGKAKFWEQHKNTTLNDRQRLLLNKVIDGFEGKLTSSKWAKIAKCSTDTALRDIQDLIAKNILQKDEAGGRSTGYEVVM